MLKIFFTFYQTNKAYEKIGVLDFKWKFSSLLNMINKLGFDAVRIDMSSEINLKNINNLILQVLDHLIMQWKVTM